MVRVIRGYTQQLLRPSWRLGLALVAILAAGCATTANSAAVDTDSGRPAARADQGAPGRGARGRPHQVEHQGAD